MSFIGKKKSEWKESAWLLGICDNGFDDLKTGHIHWISEGKYNGKKWFADPFILDYNETTIHILVEEFDYQVHRGRIAKLTVDRSKWEVADCKILLDLDTHLSFPMIWRDGETVFVCPENYHSGGWNMYRYNQREEKLDFVQRLIDEKLTDATILKNGGAYYVLSTFYPSPNGKKLTIWRANELTGHYEKEQEVVFNENIGRNAGMIFSYNGKPIRPAQESNYSYGHGLVFQSVIIENGKFSFKEIRRFYSPHPEYNAGMHTYNQHSSGLAVIDVKGWRYPHIARTIERLGKVLVALHLKKQYIPQ